MNKLSRRMDTSFLSEIGLTPGEIKTYIAIESNDLAGPYS